MGSMYDWTVCLDRAAEKIEKTDQFYTEEISQINELAVEVLALYDDVKRRIAGVKVFDPVAFDNSDVQASLLHKMWGTKHVYAFIERILDFVVALFQDLSDAQDAFGNLIFPEQLKTVTEIQKRPFLTYLTGKYNSYNNAKNKDAQKCFAKKSKAAERPYILTVLETAKKLSKMLREEDRQQAKLLLEKVSPTTPTEDLRSTANQLTTFVTDTIKYYRKNEVVAVNPEKVVHLEVALNRAISMLKRVQDEYRLTL